MLESPHNPTYFPSALFLPSAIVYQSDLVECALERGGGEGGRRTHAIFTWPPLRWFETINIYRTKGEKERLLDRKQAWIFIFLFLVLRFGTRGWRVFCSIPRRRGRRIILYVVSAALQFFSGGSILRRRCRRMMCCCSLSSKAGRRLKSIPHICFPKSAFTFFSKRGKKTGN